MIKERIRLAIGRLAVRVAERAGLADAWNRGDDIPSRSLVTNYGSADAAMQVSALSSCVRLIAGNVAKLPIHAFRRDGDERSRERDHPIEFLLNRRPNSWQTANEFRKMMTAHAALHGNAVALKRKEGARLVGLIPYAPERVRIVREDEESPPIYVLTNQKGIPVPYPASDVFHLRDLTLDGVVGMSRMAQARQGIALSHAAETYGAAYFFNGAEAGVALKVDKTLTDAQRTNLIASWREAHQGPSRAHTPTVLEGGIDLRTTTVTNKDSQLLELRSFQVEDIARIYGVPPHMIGLTEKQTSYGTGVESMALGFLQFHLLDWLVMWETAIARDLLDEAVDADVFAEHLVDALLRADFKTRMEGYVLAITNGIMSRNEARQRENLEPYPGGEEFLTPLNMSTGEETDPEEPEETEDEELDDAARYRRMARFPSERPRVAWRRSLKTVQRALGAREVSHG